MEDRFNTFTVLIANITRNIRKIKTEEMTSYSLKSPHVSCLYYLYKEKNLTSKQLCDICDEDKAAISRSLEYLEKEEYIVCQSNMKKRYNSPFTLTIKGEKIGKIISDKIDQVLFKASEGLSEEERDTFYKCLNLINKNLQKIYEKYGE